MSLFLDIGTGSGLASSTGIRPYLPPLLAGALARGDMGIDFDGTDFSFLESTAFLAAIVVLAVVAFLVERSAGAPPGRSTAGHATPSTFWPGCWASASARSCSRARSRTTGRRSGSGSWSARCAPLLGWIAIGGLVERVRTRLEPDQAALLTAYADGAALILAAIAVFVPPLAYLAIPRVRAAHPRREAPRGPEVRRSEDPPVVPKKLVLAVIDSLKPDMLDQAVAEGEAPALAALLERGTYIRDCVSTFPSVTPVASAAIATGYGPGEHHIPSMNWFHRGEERYVEYGSSLPATRAFGIVRSLYDTVYNMNLAHLTRAHRTVFEHLDDAGFRTACTTYLIYSGRTRHDPSGASVYRRIAEAAQFRHSVYGARELFYADLFDSRDTGCTSALGMPGQRDRHTAASAPTWSSTTCSTSCSSRCPTTTPTPTRPGPMDRSGRSRRPTARWSGSCTWRAARRRSSRSTP